MTKLANETLSYFVLIVIAQVEEDCHLNFIVTIIKQVGENLRPNLIVMIIKQLATSTKHNYTPTASAALLLNMARRPRMRVLELDGRTLEGGGQLLRNTICLSALTGIPIRINDIRGRRSGGGGLKAQHLACVKWLAHACNAEVEGAGLKSRTLTFRPEIRQEHVLSPAFVETKLPGGRTMFECSMAIGTAGSTSLALQAILPYLLFSPQRIKQTTKDCFIRLHMSGGTNVSNSPSYEYITQVLLPTLGHIGLPYIVANLEKRGWSTGSTTIGSFTLDIPIVSPFELQAFRLRPNDTKKCPPMPSRISATFISPTSCHSHLQAVLPHYIQRRFGEAFTVSNKNLEIICEDSKHDKRLYLILVAVMETRSVNDSIPEYRLGSDWLYDRKIRSLERSVTEMVERVAQDLFGEWKSGGWVDEHMRDQLVIFEALARGQSHVWPGTNSDGELRVASLHTQTAKWVVESMLRPGNDVAEESTLRPDKTAAEESTLRSGDDVAELTHNINTCL